LDVPLRLHLRRELRALQGDLDATTILVTHDPAEAALLADEILVLEGGEALQSGPTGEVFRRPADETVARLLGAENVAWGVAASATEIAIGDGVMLKVAGPALRPDAAVGWSFSPARGRVAANGFYQGAVEGVTDTGMERHITVRLGDARIRLVAGASAAPPHGPCRFDIDADAVQVWPSQARWNSA
jgi:ABC-type sugar transport system ATPase subunit